MSGFYKLAIQDVRRETPAAVSIAFQVPEALQANYQFEAGQYVNLKLTLDGKEIRRAYSICSAPDSGELRIAVKAVSNGLFSQFANTQLQVGAILEVATPEGKFTLVPDGHQSKNYAAFVAGSGITPVMAILKTVLKQEPQSTFVLIYGNKTPADAIFYQELHDLQQKYVGRFFVHFVFSQSNTSGALFGRIDKAAVNFVLKNKHSNLDFDTFFLCGPEEMIQVVNGVLKEQNVPESKIKFELFTSSATEKSIEKTISGHTKITVIVDGDESTFEMSQKETILDAALKNGIDAPYSCQGGICSSCLAKVTAGTAEMKKNSILTEDEIQEGLILTCQAHATSDHITVDYDEV